MELDLMLDADHFLITLLGMCALLLILCQFLRNIARVVAQERTRREIAAYIASGSMRSDAGERLLRVAVSGGPACP